jgi:protein TonB
MSQSASLSRMPDLDDPRGRLLWIVPSAILIWFAVLIGFSFLLKESEPHQLEFKPIEARIVELPPELGGLAGGGGAAGAQPQPKPIPKPKPAAIHHAPKARPIPAPIVSPFGTAKKTESPPSAPGSAAATASRGASGSAGAGAGEGSGSGGGIGHDDIGAHAVYSPTPEIPDEMREDVFQAEAVAHFKVDYNGDAVVKLSQATSNERLNQLILETLRKWRFAPAIKGGVAIPSEFDLRIPIAVQ